MIVRAFFIVSLLVWVVALDELLPIFSLIIFFILTLMFHGFTLVYMFRTVRLLMWLFVPIFLFHGLFTPGRLIQEPIYIPLSIEGLQRGVYLAAHITLIFFCALLVFRVFHKKEWLSVVDKWFVNKKLKIYIMLLISLKSEVGRILNKTKAAWLAQGKPWVSLPQLMVDSIQEVLFTAKHEAKCLWESWDSRMHVSCDISIPLWSANDFVYISLMFMGWGMFWMM